MDAVMHPNHHKMLFQFYRIVFEAEVISC